ncbi:MAG: putative colanic acid biosynthesis glycosyltransferase [Psychroserpens sp.]|jgi:glycosyltransferase involved in cell wall biosynthesis
MKFWRVTPSITLVKERLISVNNPPLLSIVTIVYNGVYELQNTIDSVSKVKEAGVEFIIIDGGSKDGTVNIIEQNLQVVNQFISEPDNGIYDAMNKGIDLASGDYVIFMNAGDCFSPSLDSNTLLSELKYESSIDIIYSDSIQKVGDKRYYIPLNDKSAQWWKKNLPCHQCCIIKRSILLNNKFSLKFSISADSEQLMSLFSNFGSKKHSAPIAVFEIGGISNSWPNFKSLLIHLKQMLAVRRSSTLSRYKIYSVYIGKFICMKIIGSEKYYQISYRLKGKKELND